MKERISKIDSTVRKSFERAGTTFNNDNEPLSSSQYNYFSYIHFKAFNEILIENNVKFNPFRKEFETFLGDAVLDILLSANKEKAESKKFSADTSVPTILKESLTTSLQQIDTLIIEIRETGLVALADRNNFESDIIEDWANDLSELQFSISLDGDATQSAQILLQEQGFRLYPDLIRFGITSLLKTQFQLNGKALQSVNSEEYYMDTDYNSDPDKFSVKEVLLNIVLESN